MLILRMRRVILGRNDGMDTRGNLELRVDSMLGFAGSCLSASASEPIDESRATASGHGNRMFFGDHLSECGVMNFRS